MNIPRKLNEVFKELRLRKIKWGDTFYCPQCKRKGCIPHGGAEGSLVYCEDCFYKNCCQKDVKHILSCCQQKTKIRRKKIKGSPMSARKRRKMTR